MKRFSYITALLLPVLTAGLIGACHKPAETSASASASAETTTIQTTSTAEVTTATTTTATATASSTPVTETIPPSDEPDLSDTTHESTSPVIATATDTYVEDRHVAKGKFNYVLKNNDWKFDGEMYYHKYKDGTVVYYDKEVKAWLVMDKSGQGWYYDSEIDDFVRDE